MTYSAEVLADTPLAYWKLGEASGTTATDSSGNANDGTYTGSPTLGATGMLTGDPDTAVTFDGSTQYMSAPLAAFAANALITVEAWAKWTSTSTNSTIVCSDTAVAGHKGFALFIGNAAGKVSFGSYGSSFATTSAATFNDGNRHHLVGTYDGTQFRLYVDETLAAGPTTASLPTGASVVYVAERGNNTLRFAGTVEKVAVYSGVLSTTRITAHYNAGTSSGSTPISVSDTGAGSDAVTVAAQVPVSDTGTGADAVAVQSQTPLTDSGSGTDTLGVAAQVPLTESVTASDALTVQVLINLTDTGSGTDSAAVTSFVALVDASTADDQVMVGSPVTLTDDGTGTDTLTANATIPLDDTVTASGELLVTTVLLTLDDTGQTVDDLTVQVLLDLSDSAAGADAITAHEAVPPRDITLSYTLGGERWAASYYERWADAVGSDRWTDTKPGSQP